MLQSIVRLIAFATLFLLLIGCSATGPRYQPPAALSQHQATVYVYRPAFKFYGAVAPDVYLDGQKIFALQNNGHGVLVIAPGEHQIEVRYENSGMTNSSCFKPVTQTLSLSAGADYYVRYAMPQPVRPEPKASSVGLALFGPLALAALTVELQSWNDEMCTLPLRFGLINKDEGIKEISKTKLVEGATFEAGIAKLTAPAVAP
jgi:hypothetical protein